MMRERLGVFVPRLGIHSETFIRRHVRDLWPHRTAVVSFDAETGPTGEWQPDCPTLFLHDACNGLAQKAKRLLLRRIGLTMQDDVQYALPFLRRQKTGVLLGEYLDQTLRLFPLARKLGIPLFAHAHGYDISACLRDREYQQAYLQYNESAGVITMSEASRQRLLALGLEPSKVFVVPYGVDVPDVLPEKEPSERIRCLAVGRMVGKKAPILLLDAFRRAVAACPDLHLDYIGGGPLFPAAQQFVHAFDLEAHVTLSGGQPSDVVRQHMRRADVFLQHSFTDPVTGDEEGLPVAILEAMAYGLPVLSTRHAGIPEAVLGGETGLLVEEGDSVGMADRLVALVQDPAMRLRFGQAGWQRAKERFTWQKERAELLRVLKLSG